MQTEPKRTTFTATGEATSSARVRAKLAHPVVDGDGHAIEFGPVFFEYLQQAAGTKVLERYRKRMEEGGWFRLSPEERTFRRVSRPASWALPAKNTLDRTTAILPKLLRARLDDFGLDFTTVYPSLGIVVLGDPDEELRRAAARALNLMYADLLRDQSDRMTPVATIPAHTPEEAIEELEYAVRTLGYKVVMIASAIKRPIPSVARQAPELANQATWIDPLCMDGPYDYDPLWAKCLELKVAVTSHTPGMGWGARTTTTSYIYNHVGGFAACGEAFAKALVLGGVTRRFPTLRFAFLEGGVAWASELYAGLVGHCGKRNRSVIGNYDPRNVDREAMLRLIAQYGDGVVPRQLESDDPDLVRLPIGWYWIDDRLVEGELDRAGIASAQDLRAPFETNFFFGCEADDPFVSLALDRRVNPFGSQLQPLFSSDLGHWDVPDMNDVLHEAYELVERELVDEDGFRAFVFENCVKLHGGMNPDFFKGTVVEEAAAAVLRTQPIEVAKPF